MIFTSTLNQTAFLFAFIVIGFFIAKFKQIPENSAAVLSKLENIIFIPALVGGTFISDFTPEKIGSMLNIFLISSIVMIIIAPIAIIASRILSGDKYIQNIFTYGLTFSNFGFMGNAVVKALFPEIFAEYIIFTLPLWILIYLWGVPVLLLSDSGKKQTIGEKLKNFLNPMFIAMIIGMIIGITGIRLPEWIVAAVTTAGNCMSPVAMLLTGITVSSIDFKKTFTNAGIYAVTIVRLIAIPLLFVVLAQFIPFDKTIYVCTLCSLAMPLGLNTVVIPSAYGKDTSVPAGMAVVSHLLSCITIPLLFAFFI